VASPSSLLDPKALAAVVAALGVGASAMAGYVTLTTPEAQACAVALADARARLELHVEARDACKVALEACAGGAP
jgi:hypothetical protein